MVQASLQLQFLIVAFAKAGGRKELVELDPIVSMATS